MKSMAKVGRLSDGYEKGKGQVIHAVENDNSYAGKAVCGTKPAISWSDRKNTPITCPKCLIKLNKLKAAQ